MTDFSRMCSLLGELYETYRDDKGEFEDFMQYNDLGLPLAYFVKEGLVTLTEDAKKYVVETWRVLMMAIGADEDAEYESLEELLTDFWSK